MSNATPPILPKTLPKFPLRNPTEISSEAAKIQRGFQELCANCLPFSLSLLSAEKLAEAVSSLYAPYGTEQDRLQNGLFNLLTRKDCMVPVKGLGELKGEPFRLSHLIMPLEQKNDEIPWASLLEIFNMQINAGVETLLGQQQDLITRPWFWGYTSRRIVEERMFIPSTQLGSYAVFLDSKNNGQMTFARIDIYGVQHYVFQRTPSGQFFLNVHKDRVSEIPLPQTIITTYLKHLEENANKKTSEIRAKINELTDEIESLQEKAKELAGKEWFKCRDAAGQKENEQIDLNSLLLPLFPLSRPWATLGDVLQFSPSKEMIEPFKLC